MKTLNDMLKEIEARANAATPGPWDNRCKEFSNSERARHIWSEYGWLCTLESPLDSKEVDAAFIAHARTDVPKLLAMLRLAIAQRNVALQGCNITEEDFHRLVAGRDGALLKLAGGE